jgi:hypothetical protein
MMICVNGVKWSWNIPVGLSVFILVCRTLYVVLQLAALLEYPFLSIRSNLNFAGLYVVCGLLVSISLLFLELFKPVRTKIVKRDVLATSSRRVVCDVYIIYGTLQNENVRFSLKLLPALQSCIEDIVGARTVVVDPEASKQASVQPWNNQHDSQT